MVLRRNSNLIDGYIKHQLNELKQKFQKYSVNRGGWLPEIGLTSSAKKFSGKSLERANRVCIELPWFCVFPLRLFRAHIKQMNGWCCFVKVNGNQRRRRKKHKETEKKTYTHSARILNVNYSNEQRNSISIDLGNEKLNCFYAFLNKKYWI